MFTNVHTNQTYEIQSWVPATQGLYAERTKGQDNTTVFYVLVVGWAHLEMIDADRNSPTEEVWPITIVDAAKCPTQWRPVRKLTTNPNREKDIVR